jgi:hypothetical protein
VESDKRVTVRKPARAYRVSTETIHTMLHKDLNLSKKSASWVPQLLNAHMKKERVRISKEFLVMAHRYSMSMFDNIVNMGKTGVSFHTHETKQRSKQWLEKGKPGPIKAKVHAMRKKQMVLALFNFKVLIYTNFLLRGKTVNALYIIEALT